MFVTYPQSGNGQRQVMSDHRRNMFLSFHLVVVSRDPRVRVSLSLSQAIGSRNNLGWLGVILVALLGVALLPVFLKPACGALARSLITVLTTRRAHALNAGGRNVGEGGD